MKQLIAIHMTTATLLAFAVLPISARAESIGVDYSFTGVGNVIAATDTTLTLQALADGSITSTNAALNASWNPVSYSDTSVLDLNTGALNGTFTMVFADGATLTGSLSEDDSAVDASPTQTGPFTQTLTFTGGTGEFAAATGFASGAGFVGTTSFTVSGTGTVSNSAVPEPASLALLGAGLASVVASKRRNRTDKRRCTMTKGLRPFAIILAAAAASAAGAFANADSQSLSTEAITGAATRAIGLLQSSQAVWDAKRSCASCHHQLLGAMAFRIARQHGIPVDERLAATNVRHSFDFSDLEAAITTPSLEPAAFDAYRLVAAEAAGMPPNLSAALQVRLLLSVQEPSGEWKGVGQRPPSSHSVFTHTALALRAVRLYRHPCDADRAAVAIERARTWLLNHRAPDTEGRSFQLLGLLWAGAEHASRQKFAQVLEATQHLDGGWSSIDGRESEAYSTGQALYALHESAGVPTTDPRWQRGLEFLLRTQASDGSWHVRSRLHDPLRLSPPYFESGYPYGHDQFISAAGANWAVTALATAMPQVSGGGPAFPEQLMPRPPGSWVETILFGTVSDLKKLLDGGFDPKSAKLPGGTTALMMAAPDVPKMRVLIERGVDVNARSHDGYTALTVSARYRGADEAIRSLLDAGARVTSPDDQSFARLQVLGIAAHAGNWRSLPPLRQAGGDIRALVRIGPTAHSPMALAIRDGDVQVARTLLDLGVDVNESKSDPWSPLGRAVLNNNLELARLFLSRGADVNFIDRYGYTPLLLAASIDFGESKMLDLLLASGANIQARNTQGESALDLARRYRHVRLAKRLEKAADAGEPRADSQHNSSVAQTSVRPQL